MWIIVSQNIVQIYNCWWIWWLCKLSLYSCNGCGKADGDCKVYDIQPKILEVTRHPGQGISSLRYVSSLYLLQFLIMFFVSLFASIGSW
jgi:hypothetical protein